MKRQKQGVTNDLSNKRIIFDSKKYTKVALHLLLNKYTWNKKVFEK